jgi:transcriptional regulator with XRE-family HTH domain
MPAASRTEPRVGALLREWRQRRRLSQLDLALEAGVSARHLSFVETGRSRPSPEMLLQLAEQLDVPFRERNRLMLAGGYAPVYVEHDLEDPEMEPVRAALDKVLKGHEPYPAAVVDREWEMVAGNRGVGLLVAGIAPELLEPPVNVLRVALHPDGMAPRIANLGEWRAHLLERLARQVTLTGDPALATLLDELSSYPGPAVEHRPPEDEGRASASEIVAPLRLNTEHGELAFFSTITTFGTAIEITVSELAIESFYPADGHTAEVVRAIG